MDSTKLVVDFCMSTAAATATARHQALPPLLIMLPLHAARHFRKLQAHAGQELELLSSGGFLLQRSTQALALEGQLDTGGLLGACQAGGVPRLPRLPERACKPLHCLWSARHNVNVDLWLHPLSQVDGTALRERCPLPAGGQVPGERGSVPEVSARLHAAVLLQGSYFCWLMVLA